MTDLAEAGVVTGTADRDYDLIWFAGACMTTALRMETFIEDARKAGDDVLADLFVRAQRSSVRGAEEAKALLGSRLAVG